MSPVGGSKGEPAVSEAGAPARPSARAVTPVGPVVPLGGTPARSVLSGKCDCIGPPSEKPSAEAAFRRSASIHSCITFGLGSGCSASRRGMIGSADTISLIFGAAGRRILDRTGTSVLRPRTPLVASERSLPGALVTSRVNPFGCSSACLPLGSRFSFAGLESIAESSRLSTCPDISGMPSGGAGVGCASGSGSGPPSRFCSAAS
mmetsp:Transcript_24589/g.73485  ORF Transcript_24589/g.73485 Transcript_24589/m.73485 type:complete len:205 (-) Transcript_24589:862-1476(-)